MQKYRPSKGVGSKKERAYGEKGTMHGFSVVNTSAF
jgi:hypothetical protein